MTERLHLAPKHRAEIEALLQEHLPGIEVWAYGSRVNGRSHDGSDLDLALRGPGLEEIQADRLAGFVDALQDSTIPFLVEAHDWARLPESFHREIQREHLVLVEREERDVAGETIASSPTTSRLYHPTFPQHWERRPLHSLAEWVNGLAFRKIQFSSTGKPVIKIAEIKGGISGQTKFTNQTFDDSVRIQPGDLLFSWSGQPETSIDAFWWRGPEGWLNQHVFRVTPTNGIDTTFFYYLLRYLNPNFIGIARNKQTTGLGHVTKRDLEDIEVAFPPLLEQHAIAHILGTLDDKIELNRRRNETLEAMARALFKSWFVDFDPVRAKAEGRQPPGMSAEIAELFPDSFEESELGEIPAEWEIRPIGELVRAVGGATPSTKNPAFWEEGSHCFATPKDLSGLASAVLTRTARHITDAGLAKISSGLLPVGTVLLSSRAPIGYLAIAEIPVAVNQGFIAMICDGSVPNHYAIQWVRVNMESILANAGGTTFAEISKTNFRPIPSLLPSRPVLDQFVAVVAPLHSRVVANVKESATLAELRDTLLPRLVSGELRVQDAERLVGEVA